MSRCIRLSALIQRCPMTRASHSRISLPSLGSSRPRCIRLLGLVLTVILIVAYALCSWADPAVEPAQIPDFLAKKGKTLSAFKAVMGISSVYDGGKSRQDVKGFLLYRRPSDFRFQGLAPGGNSLFELVIKHAAFELYVPSEGKILKGGKECFANRFPDVAEIEHLIPMVLLQWKDVRFDRQLAKDLEKIVIRMTYEGKVWVATLEPKTLLVRRLVRLSPNGEVDLSADFGDFKTGEDGWLPRRFDVQCKNGGWRTSVRIEKIETNPFLVEKNFILEPAFSTKVETCR
jgi:outer membrane lipoprotein-sorting protein